MSRATRFCLGAILALIIICTVLTVGHRRILPAMLEFLDVGETPQRSDAVFVFLGDPNSRPFVAAALYQAGMADKVLVARFQPTEVDPHERRIDLVYVKVLESRGVPNSDIQLLGSGITSTMNESQTLVDYMADHPEDTVTVVTSHYHTRRTRWAVRRNLGKDAERVRYVSAPHRNFGVNDWWMDQRGFNLILMEFVKLPAYCLFYGNAIYWILGIVAVGLLIVFRRRKRSKQTAMEAPETASQTAGTT